MRALVTVMLKDGVLDPQGKAVGQALHGLDFSQVRDVRVGKAIVLELDEADAGRARQAAVAMAERLLANPVIERFEVEILA